MSPRLVLNKLDLYFPTTCLLVLGPTVFVFFVISGAVDGIVVLDEGVASDGRDTVVPSVGTRSLILSRRGCDGIRHVVMEDEKGKSHKVSKEGLSTRGWSENGMEKKAEAGLSGIFAARRQKGLGGGGEREREGRERRQRDGQGDERTMGWRGRAFWNGKVFLVGRRRPSWAKKEQAIYISKQRISKITSPRLLLW